MSIELRSGTLLLETVPGVLVMKGLQVLQESRAESQYSSLFLLVSHMGAYGNVEAHTPLKEVDTYNSNRAMHKDIIYLDIYV